MVESRLNKFLLVAYLTGKTKSVRANIPTPLAITTFLVVCVFVFPRQSLFSSSSTSFTFSSFHNPHPSSPGYDWLISEDKDLSETFRRELSGLVSKPRELQRFYTATSKDIGSFPLL